MILKNEIYLLPWEEYLGYSTDLQKVHEVLATGESQFLRERLLPQEKVALHITHQDLFTLEQPTLGLRRTMEDKRHETG